MAQSPCCSVERVDSFGRKSKPLDCERRKLISNNKIFKPPKFDTDLQNYYYYTEIKNERHKNS
jgi:hypothetical protein